ncbi:hypothetical protein A2p41 [Lactobacillus phage A2]|uniref:Uncharacterized protein n=1 Tax=Lactobacillus phage A2 TaxID=51369 RepID=Q9T0X8_9CAUD|nr:hypothetical protein A2p41 [Lactobacillus phage A2]CAB63675.1 hypothetical protein [Lactobacillus phage A2]
MAGPNRLSPSRRSVDFNRSQKRKRPSSTRTKTFCRIYSAVSGNLRRMQIGRRCCKAIGG